MSPWTLRSRPAHSHTPRHCRVSRHYFTRLVVTHTRSSHIQALDSSGETERHNSGIVDFPASHRLEAARPPTNLPPTNLLRGYLGRSAPRPGPAPRPLARSPDQPAGAPPRGRARVRRPYYTLVVTRGFSLYRIGLYVTLYYN